MHALNGGPFALRVRALHDAWRERREVNTLASAHDRDSQLLLLMTLHGWTIEALSDIHAVYGDDSPISVDGPPDARDTNPCFGITLAENRVLAFSLLERNRAQMPYWYLGISRASPGGEESHAGTDRRSGHWNRGRLEELLLTLLGAYERSLGGNTVDSPINTRPASRPSRVS